MSDSINPAKAYASGDPAHDWRATVARIQDAAKAAGASYMADSDTCVVTGTYAQIDRVKALVPRSVWAAARLRAQRVTWVRP